MEKRPFFQQMVPEQVIVVALKMCLQTFDIFPLNE